MTKYVVKVNYMAEFIREFVVEAASREEAASFIDYLDGNSLRDLMFAGEEVCERSALAWAREAQTTENLSRYKGMKVA